MLAKAPGLGADMVILDLEDAVAPLEKDAARDKVIAAVNDLDWGDTVLGIRVNGWDTEWTHRDVIDVLRGCSERLDVLLLPKVESAAQVIALDLLVSQVERALGRTAPVGFEAQIETARGVLAVEEISGASERLEAIVFGPADYAASVEMPVVTGGIEVPGYPGDHFHYVFSRMLVAARAHGIQVIDGPYLKISDLDGLRAYAERTHLLGFDGKWAVHPDQVAVINDVFSPAPEEFERALGLLAAYEEATTTGARAGAVRYQDEMIDEASRKMASKLVARGERAGLRRPAR